MAFKHYNTQTLTTNSLIHQVDKNTRPQTLISIYNGHGASIFIGDSTITTTGATIGRLIASGTSQTFNASAGDMIYGISAANSNTGAIVITYSA
jgi:hypothetical protein